MAANNLDSIADFVLPDSYGKETRLGDLWRDKPTVVVWLRHYG
jgi:hypothetical protein